ncbi:hypothetical protein MTO96_034390 [Rhipicephalus appendiculatus]
MHAASHRLFLWTLPLTPTTQIPVKYILDKFDELYCPYKNVIQAAALFNSMVHKPGSSSPAELLIGRKLRTFIPTLPGNLKPHYSTESHQQLLKRRQKAQHKHGDSGTHLLPTLEKHQPVWVRHKNTWQKAVITQVGPQPRRYTVQTTDGAILVRNCVHLRPRVQRMSDATHSAEDYTLDERGPTTEPIPVPSVRDPTPPSHPGVSQPRSTYVTRTGRHIRPPARYQN